MSAQAGKDFLLKMGDGAGPEVFTNMGGFRSNSLTINNETIDVTTKDSAGKRELLSGGGIQSFSTSGSGVFSADAQFALANTACLNKTTDNYQIIVPGLGTYEGAFQITSLEFGGEHNGEATYSISLESAGAISFTAV